MPKKMAADITVIMCVLVLVILVPLIFAMNLMDVFVKPVVTPPNITEKPLNVQVQIRSEASQGETLLVNLGDEPVEGIRIRIPPSASLEGTEQAVGKLLGRETGEYTLEVKVRTDAPAGESEESLEVSSLSYSTTEDFTLRIV
jgi:uncharacterized membrane protein